MKRLRLCLFFIIPLILFGRASPAAYVVQQEDAGAVSIKKTEPARLGCEDRSPLLYERLSIITIKFLSKSKDNETLTGQFASPMVMDFRRLEFKLTPETKDERGLFFRVDGEWEEEISRKTFLKKFKNDFWLAIYLTVNQQNILCEAHQFQNWEALRVSYAQGKGSYSVDTPKFWQNLKIKLVYFYHLDTAGKDTNGLLKDGAYWISIAPTDGVRLPEDDIPVKLDNGQMTHRTQKFFSDKEFRIIDHGIFLVDDGTIFHTQEIKTSKLPRVRVGTMEFGATRIRPKPVDKKYFVDNLKVGPWICFYDEENQQLSRVVEAVPEEESKENKNGKNGNGKNGKNNQTK